MSSEAIVQAQNIQDEVQQEMEQGEDTVYGDTADSRRIGFNRKQDINKNSGTDRPDAPMTVSKRSREYNMRHEFRGRTVIFKYSEFRYGGPPGRECAEHDTDITEEAFKILGFGVTVYSNLKKRDFIGALRQCAAKDHEECDALVIVFMSHGFDKNGKEYLNLYDDDIETSELWKEFTPDKCPGLAGKPKLFFIQACRGENTDKGVNLKARKGMSVMTDAMSAAADVQEDYAIPLHADMLMMWASYPGMFAFKSSNNGIGGSVFIHFLAKVLREDHQYDDLATMLLTVTREVAVQYESYCPGSDKLNHNKQIPYTVSTLMRKMFFKTK
ncbi:unnamed protein product [Meganyctiphanes norvegica]|uniref:Caspase n=1 Tax=Meganyctiphanes norvegica TaxID=48144 RepID=A0AAV2Q002_MEGNR